MRGRFSSYIYKLALSALAAGAIAVACGGGDDGDDANGSGTASPTVSFQQPTPQPTDNCVPGDGPPSEGVGPDLPGTVTFVRLVFGCQPDIYTMDANGDNARVLAEDPSLDDEADLSPDGSKVVFFSNREGNAYLYTINIDGSGLTKITGGGGGDVSPRWSPDGSRIAFSHGGSIYVIPAEGGQETLVMDAHASGPTEPCRVGSFVGGWSPDGQRIVYYSSVLSPDGNLFWVCAVDVDDSDVEVLVSEPGDALHAEPVWSPDGTMIAFRDDRDMASAYEIYTLDLETGEETNVTNNPALDIEPAFSPDGEWIMFASNRDDPNFDLYVIRPDGTDLQRVLDDPDAKDSYPSWR